MAGSTDLPVADPVPVVDLEEDFFREKKRSIASINLSVPLKFDSSATT